MHCTVDELGERMSSAEFTRWCEFGAEESFGMAWNREALLRLMCTVANGLMPRTDRRSWAPSDFEPAPWSADATAPVAEGAQDAASLSEFVAQVGAAGRG